MSQTVKSEQTSPKRETKAPRTQKSSPDVVVDAILSGLRSGRLVPGQRLVEADLTHSLNISRGPVREALKRLSAEGIVTLSQNRGAYLRALSQKEVDDILRVLEVVTSLVVELATRAIGSGSMRPEFETVSRELMDHEARGDTLAFMDKRREYYDVLIKAANNQELARIIPMMQIHLLRLQFQTRMSPQDRRKQFEEYRAMTDTVLSGDAKRAARLTRIHIKRTRLSISRMPADAFAPSDGQRTAA